MFCGIQVLHLVDCHSLNFHFRLSSQACCLYHLFLPLSPLSVQSYCLWQIFLSFSTFCGSQILQLVDCHIYNFPSWVPVTVKCQSLLTVRVLNFTLDFLARLICDSYLYPSRLPACYNLLVVTYLTFTPDSFTVSVRFIFPLDFLVRLVVCYGCVFLLNFSARHVV